MSRKKRREREFFGGSRDRIGSPGLFFALFPPLGRASFAPLITRAETMDPASLLNTIDRAGRKRKGEEKKKNTHASSAATTMRPMHAQR